MPVPAFKLPHPGNTPNQLLICWKSYKSYSTNCWRFALSWRAAGLEIEASSDNPVMFLKAASLSLALLIASRLLGLVRESAQAAALGATGLADVAVLMLTLPDWLAGLLASGALAYVLLPAWAHADPAAVRQMQRKVARVLLAGGVGLGLLLALAVGLAPEATLEALAPGLPPALVSAATQGLLFSAIALPAALLAALWATRLQHEQDFVGLYAANLVVNGVLIAALLLVASRADSTRATALLGTGLLLAMGLRLGWLMYRQRRLNLALSQPSQPSPASAVPLSMTPLPAPSLWLWAALSAGLPLALPFVARSLASQQGEGALTMFNYAWKLVELPLVLAIQLVASLAFPGIARAFATGPKSADQQPDNQRMTQPVTQAFALAWTLACAAAAALLTGAPAIAKLLFGWGRMPEEALAQIAQWGAAGAWGLLPQALMAVALTVLAAQSRMRVAVLAFAVALTLLVVLGTQYPLGGPQLMWLLNALYAGVALVCVAAAVGGRAGLLRQWLPVCNLVVPLLVLLVLVALQRGLTLPIYDQNMAFALMKSAGAAIVLIVISVSFSGDLRRALKR